MLNQNITRVSREPDRYPYQANPQISGQIHSQQGPSTSPSTGSFNRASLNQHPARFEDQHSGRNST